MEDRLTNLRGHFSTPKPTIGDAKDEVPTDVIIPTENKEDISENVKEIEEPIQEIIDEPIVNNTKNEIKETLDSITTIIEEKQDV